MSDELPISQWPTTLADYPADWSQYYVPAGDNVPSNTTEKIAFGNWQRLMQGRVPTIAALLALDVTTAPDRTVLRIDGHTTTGVGSGPFILDKSGIPQVADNGLIIAATGGTNWYWRRDTIINGVEPEYYGAVGDGVADDTTPVQAALDTGYCTFRRGSNYGISSALTPTGTVQGNGARLVPIGALDRYMNVTNSDVRIDNVFFDGQTSDRGVSIANANRVVVTRCRFRQAQVAVRLTQATDCVVAHNTFEDFTVSQIFLRAGCVRCVAIGNLLNPSAAFPVGSHIMDMESNDGETLTEHCIFANNSIRGYGTPIHFSGPGVQHCSAIGNECRNINPDALAVGFKLSGAGIGNRLIGNTITGKIYGINNASDEAIIANNWIQASTGITCSSSAKPGSTQRSAHIANNIIRADPASSVHGISIDTPDNYLVDNDISGFTNDGINAENANATGTFVSGGRIANCGRYGIRIDADGAVVKDPLVIGCGGTWACIFLGNDTTVEDVELIGNTNQLLRFNGATQTGAFVRTRNAAWISNLDPGNTSWTP